MKRRLYAVLCAAALLILPGCGTSAASSGLNIVDVGGNSGGLVMSDDTYDKGLSREPSGSELSVELPSSEETAPPGETYETDEQFIPEQTGVSEAPPPSQQTASTTSTSGESPRDIPQEITPNKEQEKAPLEETEEITPPDEPDEETEETSPGTSEPEPLPQVSIGSNSYSAVNHADVKGVWISYIELAELLTGKSAAGFRGSIGQAFDNAAAIGLNTVYVHVRSHGDAYYESELFPWSKYVTGTLGAAPGFDPLKIMIEEAHSRGLSIHAWINPLRLCSSSEMSGYGSYPAGIWAEGAQTAGKYVVNVGGTYYLNPAYDEVLRLIADGAAGIAANYNVDGIHIDDYFYPTTDASFDSAAFAQSGYSLLSDFRFHNCDKLVSSLYSAVKSANPSVLFGVSCQGSMENNYNLMYADVKKWCTQSGYLDYIMPQIYYGFDNSTQPYETCLAEWDALAGKGGVPMIVGLSASKIGLEDTWAGAGKTEWITDKDILARQYQSALECRSFGGAALYSYRSVFSPDSAVSSQVNEEISALKKLF